MSNDITIEDLHNLLETFAKKAYLASINYEEGSMPHTILEKCEALFKLDYSLVTLDNTNSAICPRYPQKIFIPEAEHGHAPTPQQMCSTLTSSTLTPTAEAMDAEPTATNDILHNFVSFADQNFQELTPTPTPAATPVNAHEPTLTQTNGATPSQNSQPPPQQTIYEALFDIGRIRELVPMARYARCRQRFVVPVMLYRGKFICRSATISRTPEMIGRKVVDYAYGCINGIAELASNGNGNGNARDENDDPAADSHMAEMNGSPPPSSFSNDEIIKHDIKLLNALNVKTIVDLMVENNKTKYFFTVSSSEKADDSHRYKDFTILQLPYPGCEFFKQFRDNNYVSQGLHYDWTQSFIDTKVSLPEEGPAMELDICWADYKKWDLVMLTKNYLKAVLKYIQEDSAGLLVHCISGWDRTPLFISLVRLSLWADGVIHQSLNEMQIAYLTLAYDWYLFGHQLPDRVPLGEDILIFCFHVLKYIWDDDFGLGGGSTQPRRRPKTSSSSSSSVIVLRPDCEDDTKEDFLLDFESNDSVTCDIPIADSFYLCSTSTIAGLSSSQTPPPSIVPASAPTAYATTSPSSQISSGNASQTGRSPNFKRCRTSPITVPGASAAAARQRYDSISSHSSWQMVNDAGSVDSISNGTSGMQMMKAAKIMAQANNASTDTACGSINSNGSNLSAESASVLPPGNDSNPPLTQRKQRLNAVRNYVIAAYGKTVGLRFKEGSLNFVTLVNTITDQFF